MIQKCPGQDGRNWSPEDVSEKECPVCEYNIEFFKFDLMRSCPNCGEDVINPSFNLECAEWCEHAAMCIGQGSTLYKEVQTIRDRMGEKIEEIYRNQPDKVAHIKEVVKMADRIGSREQYSPLNIILSAMLHELGSRSCQPEELNYREILAEQEYNPEDIEHCWQIAAALLQDLDLPERYQEEIINNIRALGVKELPNPSFLVLQDAHQLVEQQLDPSSALELKTEGGKYLAEKIL